MKSKFMSSVLMAALVIFLTGGLPQSALAQDAQADIAVAHPMTLAMGSAIGSMTAGHQQSVLLASYFPFQCVKYYGRGVAYNVVRMYLCAMQDPEPVGEHCPLPNRPDLCRPAR